MQKNIEKISKLIPYLFFLLSNSAKLQKLLLFN